MSASSRIDHPRSGSKRDPTHLDALRISDDRRARDQDCNDGLRKVFMNQGRQLLQRGVIKTIVSSIPGE